MAVTQGVVGNGSGNGAATYTLTTNTIAANSVVYVETHTSGSSQTAVPSATGLTFVEIGTGIDTTNGKAHLYRASTSSQLVSNTITITTTGSPQSTATYITFTGIDMTGTNGSGATGANNTFNSAGSSAPTASVTTTANNSLVIGFGGETGGVTFTAGSNQTKQTSNTGPGFSSSAIVTQNAATATSGTSVTCNASLSGSGAVAWWTLEVLIDTGATTTSTSISTSTSSTSTSISTSSTSTSFSTSSTSSSTSISTSSTSTSKSTSTSSTSNSTSSTSKSTSTSSTSTSASTSSTSTSHSTSTTTSTTTICYAITNYGVHVASNPIAYYDNFNENTIDAALWNTNNSGDPSAVAVQNSRLEITHPTSVQYNELTGSATSNFTSNNAYVQVTDAGDMANASHQANFGARLDANNKIFFAANNGNLGAWKVVSGAQSQIGASITYNSSTHAYWRIRESGGTTFFDTSTDGSSWTNQWSLANPFAMTALNCFMQTGNFAISTTSHAYFDNFFFPDNSSTSDLATFQTDAGRDVNIVNIFQAWGATGGFEDFSTAWVNGITANGSLPMITWEPWVAGGGTSQSTYSLANIIAGNFDTYITQWANDIKNWGNTVYLRFAHEMNGTWYPWSEQENGNSAGQYISAWQHVYNIFSGLSVTNVKFVWCPNIDFVGGTDITTLYPGNSYVDIVAMDGYNFGTSGVGTVWQSFTSVFSATYSIINGITTAKPFWIAEYSSAEQGGNKAGWITQALENELPNFPLIVETIWFNENIAADWRIESSTAAKNAFATAITQTCGATTTSTSSTSSSTSTSLSTSSTSSSTSSTSTSTSSTSRSTSTSSTSSSTSTSKSTSTSSTSTSQSTSTSTSTSSTSSSTSISTSSTSSSTSISTSSTSTSKSTSTSSTSSSISTSSTSTSVSFTTSTSSTSSSISTSSTSTSQSTSTSISTSSTSSSTSTSISTSTSSTSTSKSTSTSSTSSSISTSSTSTSRSTSTSSTSTSISTSSTSSSTSFSTSSTSTSQSTSTSSTSTSRSTSTSSTSTSASTSLSTSSTSTSKSTSTSSTSTSQSTSTSLSTSTTQSATTSTSSTSLSTSTTTIAGIDTSKPIINVENPRAVISPKGSTNQNILQVLNVPDVLVDDTVALVDDPTALSGSQATQDPPPRIR